MPDLTPAQTADLDQQRAEGDTNLDALITQHRQILTELGDHRAIAELVADLDRQPRFIATMIAALAVTRLAQEQP